MANPKNLMSPEELNARLTPEQRRANASKAGKASGKARREKRLLADAVREVMESNAPPSVVKSLRKNGFECEDKIDMFAAGAYAMAAEMMKGNVKAFNTIREVLGEQPEQQARIEKLKAETERMKGGVDPLEDKIGKLFDAIGGVLDESE